MTHFGKGREKKRFSSTIDNFANPAVNNRTAMTLNTGILDPSSRLALRRGAVSIVHVRGKLELCQSCVFTVQPQQFGMCSRFHDLTSQQDMDAVGVTDRA